MKKLLAISIVMLILMTTISYCNLSDKNPKLSFIKSRANDEFFYSDNQGVGESFNLDECMQEVLAERIEAQQTTNESLLNLREFNLTQEPDSDYVDYMPGEVIVGLKPYYNVSQMETFLGHPITDKIEELNLALVQVTLEEESDFIQELEGRSDIYFAEHDILGDCCWEPNDPHWPIQWGPVNIFCPDAWDTEKGNNNVVIAILDSGIDYNHPDLAPHIYEGRNVVDNNNDASDWMGHGTICAGIAAAEMNNGEGIAGVADVDVMPVKITTHISNPSHEIINTILLEWHWAKAIVWAANHGAWVISISSAAPLFMSGLCAACRWAYTVKKCLIIASAGNAGNHWYGSWVWYPAGFNDVVAVSASDQYQERYYSDSWSGNRGAQLDLLAPGFDIYTTMPTYDVLFNHQINECSGQNFTENYDNASGTSASAPFVAGVAALYYSKQLHDNPQYQKNPRVCKEKMQKTATDIYIEGRDDLTGYGIVVASKVVNKNIISSDIVGQGSITMNPDHTVYEYNSVVQLTATPSTGWIFTGWSGDISSRDSPETITVDGDKYVVATFTDETPPEIINVSTSPHTVGFGYNMTITADVTDIGSGVSNVSVNITYPDDSQENYTMTCNSGDTYQYAFTSTWLVGQYNYTIWATDNSSNINSSSGHHFHVSAQATMSIATLKDSFSGTQYINITDPPNPPENLTVTGRGLTWNTYYNATSGQNILESYQGPVNFLEENGTWMPINNTLTQLGSNHPAYVYGYRNGNDRGLYGVYFKSNAQQEWPVAFTYNKSNDPTIHVIRSKLVGVGYVDPQSNWAYQYLQDVQSSQGQPNDYSITYPGVFTGTDVTWSYGNTGLKEDITMSNATKTVLQNHPPSQYGLNNTSSYLVFITKLDYQNLNLYNSSGMLNENVTISDAGIDFMDVLGQFKCALPLGEAYELNNESARQKLTYRIIHLNGNTYLLSGLKIADLNAMTFPVVVDPTLTVYSLSSDGYIYNSGSSYSMVQSASTGTVDSSISYLTIGQKKVALGPTYYVYRGFVFFNTSALPSNAYLDNATLSLYKKDDYSTTDFDITIQNGQPTYPHNPMQTGDYFRNYYSGNGGTLGTSRFTSGYNDITMSNLSWINKTGITKLCLRSSRDISGTTPTGNEYVNVYSNEFLGMNPPRLVINYRNQSKIKNIGDTDIKGYLLIQVQFYNSTQGKWLVDNDTLNETTARTITSGNQLALDTIFNGHVIASDLTHGTGTYRVYAAFRDPEGNILRTDDDVDLEAWWQFSKT
jgi:thermitase